MNWLLQRVLAQSPIGGLPNEDAITDGASDAFVDRIRDGSLNLSDIPVFISYYIEIGIAMAGIVSFLMLLYGGYQYIIGGVYSDMRESGKQTITYAIGGLILSLLAYGIVTIVQLFATSIT